MARSYSKLLAFEICRILWRLGCDVRVYDPTGLPMKDDVGQSHPKVQELRDLSRWSDGHFWVSPEQHGNLVCEVVTLELSPKILTIPSSPLPRPPSSRTKSTGSPSPPAACAPPKAAPLAWQWSRAAPSPSTPSTICASSVAGCACSPSRTSPPCPKPTNSSPRRAPMRGAQG